MTGMALALHEVLKEEGVALSSTEYYRRINETMRQRFPERFQDQSEDDNQRTGNRSTRPSTVVAPATRSTSSKRISLTRSQLGVGSTFTFTIEEGSKGESLHLPVSVLSFALTSCYNVCLSSMYAVFLKYDTIFWGIFVSSAPV